jgi:Protein of unknown function (DUF1203)
MAGSGSAGYRRVMNGHAVTLQYLPIPHEIAQEARATRVDRFGHALRVTKELAPCRVCLRIPTQPEDLILLSYQPLPDTGPYAEIGPTFIHARACEPYAQPERFPEDFAPRSLVLRAYGLREEIVDAVVAQPGRAPERAAVFLGDPRVTQVHARPDSYTCFDFKIVRGS